MLRCIWWIKLAKLTWVFNIIYYEYSNESYLLDITSFESMLYFYLYHIGGVMVSLLASSAVIHEFETWSGQTKDYKIGICCFSTKLTTLRSKEWWDWTLSGASCLPAVERHVYLLWSVMSTCCGASCLPDVERHVYLLTYFSQLIL
jgi:hypothetical protein